MSLPLPAPLAGCPFCTIASSHPPFPPSIAPQTKGSTSEDETRAHDPPKSHIILSTKHILAFLDIMPLTRGHVLVTPRGHFEKLGDIGVLLGRELGKWLPILSRVVIGTVLGKEPDARGDDPRQWNVVQNNGARASQTVPHVHFHIIPRPPTDTRTPTTGGWLMFGRGQRDELDDDEAEALVRQLRTELAKEVARVKEEEGVDLDLDGYPTRTERLERL